MSTGLTKPTMRVAALVVGIPQQLLENLVVKLPAQLPQSFKNCLFGAHAVGDGCNLALDFQRGEGDLKVAESLN